MKPTKAHLQKLLDEAENPRDELHEAYKKKVREMIIDAMTAYVNYIDKVEEMPMSLPQWTYSYVETHFRKE